MPKEIDDHRRRFLGTAAMTLAVALFGLLGSPARLPIEDDLPALHGATTWLNSQPLTKTGLQGKVVLIGFWTYSCINWRSSLPYVRAWAERYQGHGLVVIGVHSPEFAFERDLDNVRQGVKTTAIDEAKAGSYSGAKEHFQSGLDASVFSSISRIESSLA